MPDDFPTAHENEACLLSCVMRGGGDVRERAVDRMRPQMFDKHEDLARVVLRIAKEGRPDADTVKAEHDRPEEVGEILERRPAPQNVDRHMKAVQEAWGKLQLIQAAFDAVEKAKGDATFIESSTSLEEDVIELTQKAGGSERTDSSDVLREVLSDLEDEQGQLVTGIPTPFPAINKLTRGLQPAELTIPFGSTSMGKTAWGLTVCLHAAQEGHPVAIHTLEMSEKALHRRLLQMIAGVDLRQTTIPDEGWQKISRAAGRLDELPIHIVDTPGLDYLSHRSSLRRLQYEHGIELAFLDYLQIMGAPPSEQYSKKHHQVHAAAQGLKNTAKILDVAVMTPSQTTKGTDKQGGRRPTLSDLREAGEEPADLCVGLYRPEYYGQTMWPSGDSCLGQGLGIVAKQRNGPTGDTKLAWVEEQVRWRPLEERKTAPQTNGAPQQDSPF